MSRYADRHWFWGIRLLPYWIALGLWFACKGAYATTTLLAGSARVAITPSPSLLHVPLGGYAARKGALATGVHDPIFARALVLEEGGQRVAVVSVDMCFLPAPIPQVVSQHLIAMGLSKLAGSHLFLAATHTHSAPDPLAMDPANIFTSPTGWSLFNPALLNWTAYHIALAVKEAYAHRLPALLSYTAAQVPNLNRNRRDEPVVDRQMTVIRVVGVCDRRSIAEVVVFASHPTLYTAKMLELSADWPGVMEGAIEKSFGGVCLFLNGAEGDAAPIEYPQLSEDQQVEVYGKAVAEAACKLLSRLPAFATPNISCWQKSVSLPHRQPNGLYLAAAGSLGISIPEAQRRAIHLMPQTTTIQFVRIGKLLLIGMPCEPTGLLGIALEKVGLERGYSVVSVVALVNDWLAYALTAQQYQHGGYEAGMSFYGPGLGAVLEAAVQQGLRKSHL